MLRGRSASSPCRGKRVRGDPAQWEGATISTEARASGCRSSFATARSNVLAGSSSRDAAPTVAVRSYVRCPAPDWMVRRTVTPSTGAAAVGVRKTRNSAGLPAMMAADGVGTAVSPVPRLIFTLWYTATSDSSTSQVDCR